MVATPALPSNALSINLAVLLKRKRCHHFGVAITGNTIVTALNLLRRRMLATYSRSGSMIEVLGDSRTISGTSMFCIFHCDSILSLSEGLRSMCTATMFPGNKFCVPDRVNYCLVHSGHRNNDKTISIFRDKTLFIVENVSYSS